jgi:hypothetical protein
LVNGQLVSVFGVEGVTGGGVLAAAPLAVSSLNLVNNYFEVPLTFGGAYTGGSVVNVVVVVSCKAGTGSGGGGGFVRVKIQWLGANTP